MVWWSDKPTLSPRLAVPKPEWGLGQTRWWLSLHIRVTDGSWADGVFTLYMPQRLEAHLILKKSVDDICVCQWKWTENVVMLLAHHRIQFNHAVFMRRVLPHSGLGANALGAASWKYCARGSYLGISGRWLYLRPNSSPHYWPHLPLQLWISPQYLICLDVNKFCKLTFIVHEQRNYMNKGDLKSTGVLYKL